MFISPEWKTDFKKISEDSVWRCECCVMTSESAGCLRWFSKSYIRKKFQDAIVCFFLHWGHLIISLLLTLNIVWNLMDHFRQGCFFVLFFWQLSRKKWCLSTEWANTSKCIHSVRLWTCCDFNFVIEKVWNTQQISITCDTKTEDD